MLGLIRSDVTSIRGTAPDLPGARSAPAADAAGSFAQSLKDAVHGVDAKEHAAAEQMAAVDSGRSDDLVGAMLSSQQASLSFSMLTQVRNKVMGAIDDLVKLPL